MLQWIIDFFKPKKAQKTFLGETTTVITTERVEIVHNDIAYSFYVGTTSDGHWFAITDETQTPKFCLDASDRDEAYARGVEVLNFYFKYLDTKKD